VMCGRGVGGGGRHWVQAFSQSRSEGRNVTYPATVFAFPCETRSAMKKIDTREKCEIMRSTKKLQSFGEKN